MQQRITEELLLKNGYKEFETSLLYGESCRKMFQKCFRDDKAKHYYINFTKWEFATDDKTITRWEGSVQLYAKGSHNAVDLQFLSGWTLEAIERYVKQIYEMGFEPYEVL